MARYIDAEKLCNLARNLVDCAVTPNDIMRVPAADVQEVKLGNWLSVEDDVIFECSVCGCEISTSWNYDQDDMWQYCPHCGAKMDEEVINGETSR